MIDYAEWGAEYLREADSLRERVQEIRSGQEGNTREAAMSALRRADILYDMYLECRQTGLALAKRAGQAPLQTGREAQHEDTAGKL